MINKQRSTFIDIEWIDSIILQYTTSQPFDVYNLCIYAFWRVKHLLAKKSLKQFLSIMWTIDSMPMHLCEQFHNLTVTWYTCTSGIKFHASSNHSLAILFYMLYAFVYSLLIEIQYEKRFEKRIYILCKKNRWWNENQLDKIKH